MWHYMFERLSTVIVSTAPIVGVIMSIFAPPRAAAIQLISTFL